MRLFARRGAEDPAKALAELVGDAALPSFPGVVTKAIQMLSAPDSGLDAVGDVLATDPGVTVHLLQLVNSAAYSPRHPVSSVHQAVALVGRNQLESLLITYAVGGMMPRSTNAMDMEEFWLTSARRAVAAASLAGNTDPSRRSEHFTAALLQNMAQPVLLDLHRPYADLYTRFGGSHRELVGMELETLGWTHADVGTWMCRSWGFPDALVEAVNVHHHDAHDQFAIVQWAALIGEDGFDRDQLCEIAADHLGVGLDVVAEALDKADEEAAVIANMFG